MNRQLAPENQAKLSQTIRPLLRSDMGLATNQSSGRYRKVSQQKVEGATYTPKLLADFVASEIVKAAKFGDKKSTINIFDPAIGDGQLLLSLLEKLPHKDNRIVNVYGYETNGNALDIANKKLLENFPNVALHLCLGDFLSYVIDCCGVFDQIGLFGLTCSTKYDIIIANPPYVRTQLLGVDKSKYLAREFGLVGRLDLYYAFVIGMSKILAPDGVAGIIISNRFMTTKSGSVIRKTILEKYNLLKVWDFGDTKLFNASVLPAVLLVAGLDIATKGKPIFKSIYESAEIPQTNANNPVEALYKDGIIQIDHGKVFKVQQGSLDTGATSDGVWRVATKSNDEWLNLVRAKTWGTFGGIGKIRVGVKTTADKVFIRSDWEDATEGRVPELLKPLITHHVARRFRAGSSAKNIRILYPHELVNGSRRPVDITKYPKSEAYLLKHRTILESRDYLINAGRKWYEIWVPQDPADWKPLKLVFRDISEKPTFWIDKTGAIVNGDCYWLIGQENKSELLWLATAIGNSKFIESFYDYSFCNKLYSGRRRFITQYVEKFPLPNPDSAICKKIIELSKNIYNRIDLENTDILQAILNNLVWQAFGLAIEETAG